ncbi:chromosome transmission fidelity protein 18 homolog isoform X2 [Vitis riparia]|uniref:chromosome transmission fidelity protein 18 homolog isoform X2 n=1 Tax=Vitis riparia TaxID=96939 RepID=UPI00155A54A7|nr:chromosome transmission fidelity protein 18 homolog isoform X2 [Vitis riparia]
MDANMYIPLPEELEWLEANSHLHQDLEDYEDQEPPEPYPEEEEEQLPEPPSPLSQPQVNGQKRPLSDGPDAPDSGKRSKADLSETGAEEDWLRYSLPQDSDGDLEPMVVDEERIVSRYASEIDGDCIPVTGPGGDRVYLKISATGSDGRLKKLDLEGRTKGLILEPISVLMQRVEQDAFTKALQASSELQNDAILPETRVVNEQLWVDKYAPSSFTELLSDEQTNREVLLWLKQWDSCVFGSEIRSTTEEVLSALRRHSSIAQHQRPSGMSFLRKNKGQRLSDGNSRYSNNLDQENGNLKGLQELWNKKSRGTGSPEQKILLLCGPPGLGKTTLAHVAAKHCGYRVVEINASDDRSSSTIEAKILDVVQMNSVMADSKPNCLVIDEIDGALGDGKGAVEVILKMVICICNDLYAPALRPLRQVAKVHIFVQPTVSRVVSRLKYICNMEGLKTNSTALTALAEYTECDIRSCLNTLQFLNKKNQTLNVFEISSQVVGQKDMSRSIFDIWKEIFQNRKMKRAKRSDNCCSGMSNGFDFLYPLISNRGDYDLILDGIHENILQLHYHDPIMQKTVKCLNTLGISDLVHQYVMRTQQMPLNVYQPLTAISLHRLIAQVQKPIIEWPKSFMRYRTTFMEKRDILRSWHNKIAPYISRHLSIKSFVEDSVSPLLHILSPPTLRPVALHLLSERERNDLAQLINAMVSYSITYKNMKSDPLPGTQLHEAASDGLSLSFDPPIADFVTFKGFSLGHYALGVAVKQLLMHEIEKKKILQGSMSKTMHSTDGKRRENWAMTTEEKSRAQSGNVSHAAGCAENNIETAKSKASTSIVSSASGSSGSAEASVKLKSSRDMKKPPRGSTFFDRFKKLSSKGSQTTNLIQEPVTLERDSRPLLFKFNEGFTNAVKRPVQIREFLL